MIQKIFLLAIALFLMGSAGYAQATPGEFPWQLRRAAAPVRDHLKCITLPVVGCENGTVTVRQLDCRGQVIASWQAEAAHGQVTVQIPESLAAERSRFIAVAMR